MRVLVGGVGYRFLCDHSVGIAAIDALAARTWPATVSIEDISYNPVALVQRLEDDPPDRRFDVAILVGALPRVGRNPGTVRVYRWDHVLPSDDEIQAAIGEAVTGVIALDNTLVVTRHFGALPATVAIVEVEPAVHRWGGTFSPAVENVFGRLCDEITRLALSPRDVAQLPVGGLGADVATARFGRARVSDVYTHD